MQYDLWEPMETAPKDGTPILTYTTNGGMVVSEWEKNNHFFSPVDAEIVFDFHPECWRALPTPPPICEECGKPIFGGQLYISTGAGCKHERCYYYAEPIIPAYISIGPDEGQELIKPIEPAS